MKARVLLPPHRGPSSGVVCRACKTEALVQTKSYIVSKSGEQVFSRFGLGEVAAGDTRGERGEQCVVS